MKEMPQCVNASLFLVLQVFFGIKCDIFMAIICDMAEGKLTAGISFKAFMIE